MKTELKETGFFSPGNAALSADNIFFLSFVRLEKRAGLAVKAHPHMLRHACGFALADNGVDTRLLQDYLGHRNIQHTVRYTASNAARFKGVWKKSLVKTVPSDSKCQIPTFSSILP